VVTCAYRPYSVVGLEIEHAVVGADLQPRSLVEAVFRDLGGRPTSDVDLGPVGLSNELADHVLEIKNPAPLPSLARAHRELVAGVRRVSDALAAHGAKLLPTGMNPLMDPARGRLWRRSGGRVYAAYGKLFDLRTHGWMNVQSCHVNLPFGDEEETLRMLAAAAAVIPYLPALAASSPVVEGALGPHEDNRLAFYRTNQARVPEIAGDVVPEPAASYREYRARILRPMYDAVTRAGGAPILRSEFLNSRGAILRFMRSAMEVRVLDAQECVRRDCAIAAFTRGAIAHVADALRDGQIALPAHEVLVRDLRATITRGALARVEAPHLVPGRGTRARDVLEALLEGAKPRLARGEEAFVPDLEHLVARGSLSARLAKALRRTPARTRIARIHGLWSELAECLVRDEPWQ
jgi:gamma-glutamyl:cysteine ligase YbdK (ATP-grasp superfamily)